jgi:hypothetical protein
VVELIENELNGYLVKVDNPIGSRIVMGQMLTGDLADLILRNLPTGWSNWNCSMTSTRTQPQKENS